MNLPSIRVTWLAVTQKGDLVHAFDSPARLREFVDLQRRRHGIDLLPAKETLKRELVEHRAIAEAPVRLAGRR